MRLSHCFRRNSGIALYAARNASGGRSGWNRRNVDVVAGTGMPAGGASTPVMLANVRSSFCRCVTENSAAFPSSVEASNDWSSASFLNVPRMLSTTLRKVAFLLSERVYFAVISRSRPSSSFWPGNATVMAMMLRGAGNCTEPGWRPRAATPMMTPMCVPSGTFLNSLCFWYLETMNPLKV